MDRLNAMTLFVRVVERGSFTAAAEDLRLSRAMASKHVRDLEEALGVRLLNRTTRRLSVTEAGRVYFERCAQILSDIAEAEQMVGDMQARPQGRLRLNAPMSFGTLHLAPAVADFTAEFDSVTVDMTLSDRIVDLIEEGFDLAVRIGRLASSSLIARKLAPCRLVVCAAPGYLARHGTPQRPEDLAAHDCLGYTYAALRDEWRFGGADREISVRIAGTMQANNGDALRAAALRGRGIILQPTFIVGHDLCSGALVRLLPDFPVEDLAIYAVYPPGRHLSAKVRSFVDFLAARFGDRPEWDAWLR